jgi:hypothetical protein
MPKQRERNVCRNLDEGGHLKNRFLFFYMRIAECSEMLGKRAK